MRFHPVFLYAIIVYLFMPFCLLAQVQVLRFGKLITGQGGVLINAVVIIDKDRIVKVSTGDSAIPPNSKVVDLSHYTAIPGLIDAHTHITFYWDKAPGSRPWTQLGTLGPAVTVEAYHSIIQRELLEPRQFDSIEQAIGIFERWKAFYNSRRLHGSLGNKAPAYMWQRYEQQQVSKEPMLPGSTPALPTNGERKSLKIEESRFVDKIFQDQTSTTSENQRAQNAQSVP